MIIKKEFCSYCWFLAYVSVSAGLGNNNPFTLNADTLLGKPSHFPNIVYLI